MKRAALAVLVLIVFAGLSALAISLLGGFGVFVFFFIGLLALVGLLLVWAVLSF